MGMIDYYEPEPRLACPRCGRVLSDWQGKEADNALFVWKQGVPCPTGKCIEEEFLLTADQLGRCTLPETFMIYTSCICSTKFLLEAVGTSIDGIWSRTELIQPDDVEKIYAHLPCAQREAIRLWLQERVGVGK